MRTFKGINKETCGMLVNIYSTIFFNFNILNVFVLIKIEVKQFFGMKSMTQEPNYLVTNISPTTYTVLFSLNLSCLNC